MLIKFLIFTISLFTADYLMPNITIHASDIQSHYKGLLITAIILYVSNHIVTPILRALTFPITIITFGISSTLIGILVMYISLKINPYIEYTNFTTMILFIILVNVIWWILDKFF